jgi:uncharacterized membrane protein
MYNEPPLLYNLPFLKNIYILYIELVYIHGRSHTTNRMESAMDERFQALYHDLGFYVLLDLFVLHKKALGVMNPKIPVVSSNDQ